MGFGKGWIWPDATGVAGTLTAAYVAGREIEIHEEGRIGCILTIPAGAVLDPCILVRLDVSFDGGAVWYEGYDYLTIVEPEVGTQGFFLDLPTHCMARIALRDMFADADTTCEVYAHARQRVWEDRNRFAYVEFNGVQNNGAIIWDNGAGAADALGAGAFAYGPVGGTRWIPIGRANVGQIWITTTGGPTTSVEMQIEESFDEGTTFAPLSFVNSVLAGIANLMPNQIQFQSAAGTLANGTYQSQRFALNPNSWVRFSAQRTGAAVNAIAHLRLFHESQ